MPQFSFQARTLDGKMLRGARAAESEAALAKELLAESALLVKAQPASELRPRLRGRARFKRKELAAFMVHLASYIEGGVPILAALQDYRIPERPALDAAVKEIRRRIEGGATLSDALEAQPGLFEPLQVSMIRAGEGSGKLDEALLEVVKLVEWEEDFAGQVKQASTYPLIVLGMIGLIVVVVSIFALPGILKLLEEFHVPLPLPTRIFMALGGFLAAWGWLVVLAPTAAVLLFRQALKRPAVRLWWDTRVLAMPVAGPLATKLGMSRFAAFFAAQYRAGVPIIQLLRECEGVTGNARLGVSVRAIREGVESGERIATMAATVGHFPPLVVRMLAIGEETGQLERTLGKVSSYFDAEVRAEVKRFFQLLEPALLVVLAAIVIFVAVSILLPIYTLIGGISGTAAQ
ncbi:MAG TPA: type II secretion system F family protein [Holophagaceae bacterium]|nr:type II secretion system F family protein [Holophagaceae bacterium]